MILKVAFKNEDSIKGLQEVLNNYPLIELIKLSETSDKINALKLIDFAVKEGTSYFTFNIPNSKCEDCGHIVKAPIKECPKCGSKHITWYTRIIGYLRPLTSFGKDRRIEAEKRTYSSNPYKE